MVFISRRVSITAFRTAASLGASVLALCGSSAFAQVQDILVTARKEEETLQDVPISVAAYDAELIQRYDISDLSDVAARTPNFTFSNNLGLSQGVPVIRGVGTPRIGGSSSVGVFIDGVDTGNSTGVNLQSFDIERVEVVRGPQSTQFGRGVMAGAINYVSKRPNLDRFEANFASEVGDHELVRIEGRMSGPVADGVAVSLAGQRRSFEGFYRNTVSGRPVGESDSLALVGGLRAKFGGDERGEAYLRVAYSRENMGQPAWHQVATNKQTGAAASQRWFVGRLTGDPAKIAHNGDTYAQMDLDFYRAALHLDYDFGGVSVASVTSYNRSNQLQDTDGDYTASPDLILGPTLVGNLRAYTDVDIEDFSQELRLRSNGDGPLKWMIGGYFRKEDYHNNDYSPTGAQGSSAVLAPTPNVLTRKVETYGAFGSLSYQITPDLSVSQELRYSEDRVRETSKPRAALVAGAFEQKFTNVLPRTILEFKIDRDRMIYASAAKGNKPGGFNNSAGAGFSPVPDNLKAFDEESMWVYEAGFKTSWLDRRLTLNGAVFYIDWTSVQVNSSLIIGGLPVTLTDNAGKARGLGFEGEFRFEPNDRFDIYGGIGYAPIRLRDYVDSRVSAAGITTDGRDQIAGTPDWTGNIGAIYYVPVGESRLFLQGDLKYRSTTYATEANLAETGSKTTVDLQVGYRGEKIRASIYVNNLFDNDRIESARAFVNPSTFARSFIVQLATPRQVGLRFSVGF